MPVILLVEKNGTLKPLKVKELKEDELYKKCGLKNTNNFSKQTIWKVKHSGKKYNISLYAKTESRVANCENKYEFPPPVASCLYFGTCALVATSGTSSEYVDLTEEIWKTIYEKLHGGFISLEDTERDDNLEPDELANVSSKKKTKEGYLKDGFVVDRGGGGGGSVDVCSEDDDDDDEESYETEEDSAEDIDSISDEAEDLNEFCSSITANGKYPKKKKKQSKQELQDNITISIIEELKEEPYL